MDSLGSSPSTSHKSGTSVVPSTGDRVLNAMTASLDSVRETVREELHHQPQPLRRELLRLRFLGRQTRVGYWSVVYRAPTGDTCLTSY